MGILTIKIVKYTKQLFLLQYCLFYYTLSLIMFNLRLKSQSFWFIYTNSIYFEIQ